MNAQDEGGRTQAGAADVAAPSTRAAIVAAARLLEQGALVAFPTETVYGLGADAGNPAAIAAIYAAKGRPSNHPVIVHVAPGADLLRWTSRVPREARQLIDAFWPGPLTLILERADGVDAAVAGGQDTIGLRCPSHPVAQALLREFRQGQGGVAAPSANRFGHVSPTTAGHVEDEFGLPPEGPLACILDGGQSAVGIESTIVDLSRLDTHGPVLLRPGHIGADELVAVLGRLALPDAAAPRVSGSLDAHYAPRTPLALVAGDALEATVAALTANRKRVALITLAGAGASHAPFSASGAPALPGVLMPRDPAGFAFGLYAAMREMDHVDADIILLETPPAGSAWQGVNDRLRRAAFDSAGALATLSKKTS